MRQPAALALIRPTQWIKNLFVVAPLLLTPAALSLASLADVLAAALGFSALASVVYILNDYADREADRAHPTKRHRPLAAGTVSVRLAFTLLVLLLVAAGLLATTLPRDFALIALAYLASNLAYSFGLKHVAIVDVMIVALGFVLRVEAGAVAAKVPASAWIVIATGLLALFLALAKRRDDVVRSLDARHRKSLDGYTKPFLDMALSVVIGALLVAYLIYTTDAAVMQRLGTTHVYYTAPWVVAGILRYLQIAMVEERSGSPTDVVLTDRFLILTILGWIATFTALLYG